MPKTEAGKLLLKEMSQCIELLHGSILEVIKILENTSPEDVTTICILRETLILAKPERFH